MQAVFTMHKMRWRYPVAKVMQKIEKIKLTGKSLAKLNDDIHERDGHICIIRNCGRYVMPGEKFHHEPCGPDKQDRVERGCLVCSAHHYIRHHGRDGSREIKEQCIEYLSNLYPDDWRDEYELVN